MDWVFSRDDDDDDDDDVVKRVSTERGRARNGSATASTRRRAPVLGGGSLSRGLGHAVGSRASAGRRGRRGRRARARQLRERHSGRARERVRKRERESAERERRRAPAPLSSQPRSLLSLSLAPSNSLSRRHRIGASLRAARPPSSVGPPPSSPRVPVSSLSLVSDDARAGRRAWSRPRATGRASNDRSYAPGPLPAGGGRRGTQAVCRVLKRPSARRGPGIVSVDRNVRSKCRCSCVLQFTS